MKLPVSKFMALVLLLGMLSGAIGSAPALANTAAYNEALKDGDIVIDNTDSAYVTHYPDISGTGWGTGSSGGHYGTNYALAQPSRPKDLYVEYKPSLDRALEPGYYDVYISYRSAYNISNQVPVVIHHNKGYDIVVVNQRNNTPNSHGRVAKGNGEWDFLGTYYFNGDGTEYVRITNDGTGTDSNSYVVADAVRFSPNSTVADDPPPPLDVTLSDLQVNMGQLEPAFHPAKTEYHAEVDKTVSGIEVAATVTDAVYATVSVGGIPAVSGEPVAVPLQAGVNEIPVKVSAERTVETPEGTIHWYREFTYMLYVDKAKNDDVSLSSLTASPGELVLVSETESLAIYEMRVSLDMEQVHVTPVTSAPVSRLTVNGEDAVSGETYTADLVYGLNLISIVVIAENETTTKEYLLRVIREALPGDVTGPGNQPDGRYSVADLGFVSYHYGKTTESPDWEEIEIADLNEDGVIDEADVLLISERLD